MESTKVGDECSNLGLKKQRFDTLLWDGNGFGIEKAQSRD